MDLISKMAAISLPVKPREDRYFKTQSLDDAYDYGWRDLQECIKKLPSAQPEIIMCKDCEYGEQDDIGRWFCNDLGCQIGSEDGSGYCANAERKTD